MVRPERLPEAAAALIGAVLLFLLPVDWKKRQFTISWRQAVDIDWGTLLLFGGGLSLGNLMFSTGLADHIGQGLLRLSGAESLWGITFAAIFIAIIASETTSNTAAANMVVPGDHFPGPGRRRQPGAAGAGRHPGLQLGVHAAGIHAAQRHRLRLRAWCRSSK